MGDKMIDWSQTELLTWIRSISTSKLSDTVKNQIIAGINKYAQDNDMPVTGKDFTEADKDDLKGMCGIDGNKANTLLEIIEDRLDGEFEDQNNKYGNEGSRTTNDTSNDSFTLNIVGSSGKPIKLTNIRKTMLVREVKSLYLTENGKDTAAHKYANAKWGTDKKGQITFKYSGTQLLDDKPLSHYDCNDGLLPVFVVFRVQGGAEQKYQRGTEKELKYGRDDKDRFRKRKLRHRKYKQIILSKDQCCIMGYNDSDGIKRAMMPCKCAIASDTLFRYMKSTFEKDMKAVNLYCPVPKNICKGNAAQRHWKWPLVFIVADLSQNEINRYSKVINNRKSGSKSCPHCGCVTDRPDNVRQWRVRCTQCNKADWCWYCLGPWKGSGWGCICGNDGCLADTINAALSEENYIDPDKSSWVNKGEKIPDMRACPKCLTLIEYTHACQHMTCLGCPHEFCFKCLQAWRDSKGGYVHQSSKCVIDKVQVFT